jgi:hypothetical protein
MAKIPHYPARPLMTQETSASGAASSRTLAATAEVSWALSAIHLTYNGGTPGTKAITITYTQEGVAKTVIIGVAATVSVTAIVEIADRIVGDVNTAITVTGALLAANTNTLEVFYS